MQLNLFPLESGPQGHRQRVDALRNLESLGLLEFTGTARGNETEGTDSKYHLVIGGCELILGAPEVLPLAQGLLLGYDVALQGKTHGRLRPVLTGAWGKSADWYARTITDLEAKLAAVQHCAAADNPGEACASCLDAKRGDTVAALRLCRAQPTGKQQAARDAAPRTPQCLRCWSKTLQHNAALTDARLMQAQFARLDSQHPTAPAPVRA